MVSTPSWEACKRGLRTLWWGHRQNICDIWVSTNLGFFKLSFLAQNNNRKSFVDLE